MTQRRSGGGAEQTPSSAEMLRPRGSQTHLPRVNFRPLLYAAVGALMGVYLFLRTAFGNFQFTDVFFLALFLGVTVFRPMRAAALCLAVLIVFAGAGAGLAYAQSRRFASGMGGGDYVVTGTVRSVSVYNGQTTAILYGLTFDGVSADGKMSVSFPGEELRPADVVAFSASVSRTPLPVGGDASAESDYASDVRYSASASEYVLRGRSANPFLRLNGALYDVLYDALEPDAAAVAYALLTGSTRGMDTSFLNESRTGGIAHAFAVSGLHIGILYGAAMLLFKPLRRYAFLPAIALAACYCALCMFTVSSVRAVVMCAVHGGSRFFGRKYDFLSSISFAALCTLLAAPAQLLTASFRLSYGAVLGLALFSTPIARGLKRLRLPDFLASYFSASIAVQFFTLPIMAETFGYISVWGTALNFFAIPALPVLFLPLIVCAALAVAFPAAGEFLLALPNGMISLLLYLFSLADFTYVLSGFALGAGGAVWIAGTVLLTDRVRLKALARAVAACLLSAAFAACMVWENVVFDGCVVLVCEHGDGACALIRDPDCAVLVIDDDISLAACEDFLMRNYGGTLDAVAVIGQDVMHGVNVAAFLPAKQIRVISAAGLETGISDPPVLGGYAIRVGEMFFSYCDGGNGLLFAGEGVTIKFNFTGGAMEPCEHSVLTGDGGLKYSVKDGIIKRI